MATTFRGFRACSCLAKWLPAYEKELLRRGLIRYNIDVFQLIGGNPKSGGTHLTGGAFDIAQSSDEAIKVARAMGADATWRRPYNWDNRGGIEHTHGVLTGCPHNRPAAYQIADVRKGLNGLANRARDTGPRPLSGRTWQEGIAWAKKVGAPKTLRFGTWNVDLNVDLPARELTDRLKRIRYRVKQAKLDVLAVQECPSSGQGKHLFGTLIGRDGKPMKRVGSHGRYIFHTPRANDVDWASFVVGGKRSTVAAMTIDGRRRAFVDVHPVSGSTETASKARARYAATVFDKAIAWAKTQAVPKEDVIWLGDNNGSEAATAGAARGFLRARGVSLIKSAFTRTYNAMGKRKPSDAGGQTDYVLIHGSKRKTVERYRNVHTPKASDHNLITVQIKE